MPLNYTWLPASAPNFNDEILQIIAAKDSYLIDQNGDYIFDAISSWWCKPLGHCHPLIRESITSQLGKFEHHIPANAYNGQIEELSKRLINIFNHMDKVMYASDGSSAIEIALKLSYEVRILKEQPSRCKFIALAGAYHGETIFTLGICGIPHYTKNYRKLIRENHFISKIPYVNGRTDPLWEDCQFDYAYWDEFFINNAKDSSALVIEPIVQGAAGIKIISKDFLIKLTELAREYDLHIIADEIMVGLGRLGCLSVSMEILNIEPDIVCFAKNLTAGSIPMSAVVINQSISQLFAQNNKIFAHSHTHSCNGLATSVALSYLDWLEAANNLAAIAATETNFWAIFKEFKRNFSFITNIRVIGAIAACDLNLPKELISQIFYEGLRQCIYLRPIDTTLYIMPPLNNLIEDTQTIQERLFNVLSAINLKLKKMQ